MTIRVLLFFLGAVGLPQALAEDFSGRVAQVSRGDMLTMVAGNKRLRIRLAEIIVPKSGEPFNNRSTQSLSQICLGKPSFFYRIEAGRDGAPVGQLWCAGIYANAEQVRRGMAWVVAQFAGRRSPLISLQTEAQARGQGPWAEKKIAPLGDERPKVPSRGIWWLDARTRPSR